MPSMTVAISDLAHSIVRLRRDRAEATTRRRREPHERSVQVTSKLHDFRTSRVELATRQRRELAVFMTDLTASVGSMRDRFRTHLESMRVAQHGQLAAFATGLTADVDSLLTRFRGELKASKNTIHKNLSEYRRDRQGASNSWSGRKPVTTARPAADNAQRGMPFRPAEAAAGGARSAVVNVEAAPKVTAPVATQPMTGSGAVHVPPHEARPHTPPQPAAPVRGPTGSHTPTHGGKSS